MNPFKVLCIGLLSILSLSCKDKVICPAFQSTYILDDSVRHLYFSMFNHPDLTPRTDFGRVRKNKYGVIKKDPYWVKNIKLKTAPKENVLRPDSLTHPFVPTSKDDSLYADGYDSLGFDEQDDLETIVKEEEDDYLVFDQGDSSFVDEGEFTAEDFGTDSLGVPILAQNKGPKYLHGYDPADIFNVEQMYYNKYFGSNFLPKPKPAKPKPQEAKEETDSTSVEETENLELIEGEENETADVEELGGATDDDEKETSEASPVEDEKKEEEISEGIEEEEESDSSSESEE